MGVGIILYATLVFIIPTLVLRPSPSKLHARLFIDPPPKCDPPFGRNQKAPPEPAGCMLNAVLQSKSEFISRTQKKKEPCSKRFDPHEQGSLGYLFCSVKDQ